MKRYKAALCLIGLVSITSTACLEDLFSEQTCIKQTGQGGGVYVAVGNRPILTASDGTVTYTVPPGASCDSVIIVVPAS